jgi:hypothetical protein
MSETGLIFVLVLFAAVVFVPSAQIGCWLGGKSERRHLSARFAQREAALMQECQMLRAREAAFMQDCAHFRHRIEQLAANGEVLTFTGDPNDPAVRAGVFRVLANRRNPPP